VDARHELAVPEAVAIDLGEARPEIGHVEDEGPEVGSESVARRALATTLRARCMAFLPLETLPLVCKVVDLRPRLRLASRLLMRHAGCRSGASEHHAP
jgi:hypothetical protein